MTIDRAVLAFAGIAVLVSALLVWLFSPWWLLLTAFIGANLIQASITGFALRPCCSRRWEPSLAVPSSSEDRVMNKDWVGMATEMSGAVREVRSGAPDVMKGFSAIAQAALKAGALDAKTKELIALAISVATRCDVCVAFHAQAAVKQGASRDEIMETMGMAIYIGAGPRVMYAAQAIEAFDQFRNQQARSAA